MIKFISEEALLEIKNNKSVLFTEVVNSKKKTLEEAFNNNNIIRDTKVVGDPFDLDMSADNPVHTDFENVKRVYNNMRSLSESQASDERIWTAYTLSVFSDYMKYRWKTQSEVDMMNRYFFSYSAKRSLFRNGVARLWWIGHLTYDPNRSGDKYELTEYVCRKQDSINFLLDINFANNRDIVHTAIQVLIDGEKAGLTPGREAIRQLSEYVNTLGGIYLIDAFSRDMIYDKCMTKLKKIMGAE